MGRACSLSSTEDGQVGLTECIDKLPDMVRSMNRKDSILESSAVNKDIAVAL